MARYIFTYGNILDTSAIFLRLLQTPEIRELTFVGSRTEHSYKYWQAVETIIDNISNYLNEILATKGTRTTVAQRAYRTVLAACSSTKLADQKNISQAASVLVSIYMIIVYRYCCILIPLFFFNILDEQKIQHRNVLRGIKDRAALEEAPNSGYVACTRKEYRNKMPDKVYIYPF